MKRLSAKQIEQKAKHLHNLTLLFEGFEKARTALNEEIAAANEWRAEIQEQISNYHCDRSEKWQEGDTGGSYNEWMQEWSEALPEVDEIGCDAIDALENLPDEPS